MKLQVWIIAVAISSLCTGCFSDEGQLSLPPTNGIAFTNVEITDLEGAWEATEARFTSTIGRPVKQMELVAAGGRGVLIVDLGGRFTLIIEESGGGGGVLTGVFGIDNGVFTVVFDNEPNNILSWITQSTSNTLLLQGPVNYDFERAGIQEKATIVLNLVRKQD